MTSKPQLTVGIGASAGGIPALEAFFQELPEKTGMAFIVITHLSPSRESLLHQVIAHHATIPVHVATNDMQIAPDNIYVMPENAVMSVTDGRLRLQVIDTAHRERKPIDVFFAALAIDQGERAVGIIMSGGDSDGTLGVKAIKEYGGMTFAQAGDGAGPKNPEMPSSAISSGLVDFAIPAGEMPAQLVRLAEGNDVLRTLVEGGEATGDDEMSRSRDEICELLRNQTGHDFSGYKVRTFTRRVSRRMNVRQIAAMESYLAELRRDPAEVMALFRDLLINVTSFFRDADAFAALETSVISPLFENGGAEDPIRVWVPGAATGEEVYSIGILLREKTESQTNPRKVQIFATDIDEPALGVARAGRYPETLLQGVSSERREKYFRRNGESFVICKDVREMCVFSPHSVISDPPFSRMDLISCRNLLIYFGGDLQKQLIPIFHYALKPDGHLFLGTSESIGRHDDLFSPVDSKHRLFRRRENGTTPRRLSSGLSGALPEATRRRADGREDGDVTSFQMRQLVEAQVIERHAPPHVVVNAEGTIVFYSAGTGKFLETPKGAPVQRLLTLARRELRMELRAALAQVMETGRATSRNKMLLDAEDREHREHASLTVEPLSTAEGEDALYLVLFETIQVARTPGDGAASDEANASEAEASEREIQDLRERLQSTVEEYETALEELKSSNEELVSVNEESQSTNEEIEASKEEMQSLNEELNTINAELAGKVEDLDRANDDLKNLYESSRIATIFLDGDLVIRNFTPAASRFFNLREGDVGRPLTDMSSGVHYPELKTHIEKVFASGEEIENRLAANGDDEHYLVRLIPYRGRSETVTGVVVTFIDVTQMAKAEAHQRVLIAELNHRVKNMLTIAISIANNTLREASSAESYHETLVGRLHGMARAYSLLSGESWVDVSMRALFAHEREIYGSDRIRVSGPDIRLKPKQALAVGMIIHELVTNATKYGALSNGSGLVDVEWSASADRLELDWREKGGPKVTAPKQNGFGLKLVKGQIKSQTGGETQISFAPGVSN